MNYEALCNSWIENATLDTDLINELRNVKGNADEISDRFYTSLEFGTAGLRGVIGAGTNRMNVYTVGITTQGISEYVNSVKKGGSAAISYDSRIKSDLFAKMTASVFAANGIKVYMYDELMPTPMLSFAVRHFKCDVGVMITASHNPAKYNGYKVYGNDGCQLGVKESDNISAIINKLDIFKDIKTVDFDEAVKNGMIEYIKDDAIEAYLDCVEAQSVCPITTEGDRFSVIYSPLHGTGNKPVRKILDRIGIRNVKVVSEQELPDGNFPTVPFPNPEFRQAFDKAIELAKTYPADLLLATDPDCDRVGIAVPDKDDYRLFTGNQVGAMLLNYILSVKSARGTLEKNPIAVKTIVTTDMCVPIAEKYGCKMIDVLTGFKYIGEQIAILEAKGEESRYQLGFEESYGYLKGSYVRDKDAVVASMLICEMACYYKAQGKSLIEVYESLEKEFGFFHNSQASFYFEGQDGMAKMAGMMDSLSENPPKEVAGLRVVQVGDYRTSTMLNTATGETSKIELPKASVLYFGLGNGNSVIVRPSGTEPKIKIYVTATADSREKADSLAEAFEKEFKVLMGI